MYPPDKCPLAPSVIGSAPQRCLTLTSNPTTDGDKVVKIEVVKLLLPKKRGVGPTPQISRTRIRIR